MFISLRKAAALQKEILAAVPTVNAMARVSVYSSNAVAELVDLEMAALDAVTDRSGLMDALANIRNATAKANMEAGIQELVTRAAFLDKDISFLTALVGSDTRPSDEVIHGKVERARSTEGYGYQEELLFSTLSEETIQSFRDSIAVKKKQKVAIQDQLLELNIKNSIKLSEENVAVLTAAGLL
jgi:hypothetical protein